jgi:hypothetical protein
MTRDPDPVVPAGPLTRLRLKLAAAWEWIRDLGMVLHPCRISLLVVAAGAAFLLIVDQGRELMVRLPDEPLWWRGLAFHVCVFIWAFESWCWSRIMLMFTFSSDRMHRLDGTTLAPRQRTFVDYVPRVVAALTYVTAVIALLMAGAWTDVIIAVVIGVTFYIGLVNRLSMKRRLLDRFGSPRVRAILGDDGQYYSSIRDLPPWSRWVLWVSIGFSILCTLFVAVDGVTFGWMLGAAAVPFLGFALIVPVGSVLVYWSHVSSATTGTPRSDRSYPAVTVLFMWALLLSAVADNITDNHAVRIMRDQPAAARTAFSEAVDNWHKAAQKASRSEEPPLVIVATAGGGLRAAYWTATVLGALQDREPNFAQYVFAISGVSGGSLGATVFVTLLGQTTFPKDIMEECRKGNRGPIECAGQAVLDQDFLASPTAALLFPDLIQKFLPIFPNGSDRGVALERAWERAWGRAGMREDVWVDRRFTSLWESGGPWRPALFLNGTHVESGKRIVASNLRVREIPLADTYDIFDDMLKADMPVSTAAHNSARFTYVSPAGTLRENGGSNKRGHIVDGGYFENFGAATARETLHAVLRELAAKGKKARPFLIQISNDPTLRADDLDIVPNAVLTPRACNRFANEALSPIRALLKTRDGRGTLAYKEFLREASDARWAHFKLCAKAREPALGWVLAEESTTTMQQLVRDQRCENGEALEKVVRALTD